MSLTLLSSQTARALMEQGALLVDIRSVDEHAREHILGACNVPADQLSGQALPLQGAGAVIFHCGSGMRTKTHASKMAECVQGAGCAAYVLEGGLDAWKQAGLPVVKDKSQPLPLQRQVQIGAGSMALLGWILGVTVSPWFHLLSGFVGAGLVFAGLTGFCGMARMLAKMPWNRRHAAV